MHLSGLDCPRSVTIPSPKGDLFLFFQLITPALLQLLNMGIYYPPLMDDPPSSGRVVACLVAVTHPGPHGLGVPLL